MVCALYNRLPAKLFSGVRKPGPDSKHIRQKPTGNPNEISNTVYCLVIQITASFAKALPEIAAFRSFRI
jgi:hypothetical protein